MLHPTHRAALAAAILLSACGGGGGGSSGSAPGQGGSDTLLGNVQLLEHTPAADAVQVPVEAAIELRFDAAMALETFGDEDTWLRAAGAAETVPGTFVAASNHRVRFLPASPLQPETDYVFQLSALTSDQAGRILDVTVAFGFRTFDATPPTLAAVDVAAGAIDVARTRTFTLAFDEAVAPASVSSATVFLRDVYGFRYAATRTVDGPTVVLDPHADLPGDRLFVLVATTGVTDRAGNALAATANTSFRTVADTDAPAVLTAWPAPEQAGVSPHVQPTFEFDESMDPATVEAASLRFEDEFGSIVPFALATSDDQRTLRLRPAAPLQPFRRYTMSFLLGAAAATDVSGNVLAATRQHSFTTGDDVAPPQIVASVPAAGETRVPGSVVATVRCDEALDPARVGPATVSLAVDGEPWVVVVEQPAADTVRVTPVLALPTDAACVLTLRGGQDGLRDLAGNVPAADLTLAFTTSADGGTPSALLLPPDGATGIAPDAGVRIVFDAPMDPATLSAATLRVTDDLGAPVPGGWTVGGGGRVASFAPAAPLAAQSYYRTTVVGGSAGPRRTTGNWLPADLAARFRTGSTTDSAPPTVAVTVNGIHPTRRQGLVLPPSGFTVDVTVADGNGQWPDMGSVEVLFAGAGTAPAPEALFTAATIADGVLRVEVPADAALTAGAWTLTARARDLAGNLGQAASLPFTVVAPTTATLPFERTQVVWLRTDLDRDGNGRADFDDDLLRLGLTTAGDPRGSNARMRRLVLDGMLAASSRLYGRGSRGEPVDSGSVGLRFTTREPIRATHMQMALGGFDPEGDGGRGYGDESTGVLGRALYDFRNGNPAERNIGSSPGLGVFPGEVWLYQTRTHLQVWPSFQTAFAQKFRPLCPDMGGTPAGAHSLDGIVLAPDFDYAAATASQRARWQTIMDAADDWATVIGIILAHEVGHSVGLVAPGPAPGGLFGDSSLHDSYAGAADVMAPAVGYEAMTSLEYRFRDIDLAYLRQRVLLP